MHQHLLIVSYGLTPTRNLGPSRTVAPQHLYIHLL